MPIERPRGPKTIVLEAELLASSPERVCAWLEETTKQEGFELHGRDEDLESALLTRRDPLITISLARLASRSNVMVQILAGAGLENRAIRLAALTNEIVAKVDYGGMPEVLLARSAHLESFTASLDEQEVVALFSNPTLDDDFLIDFFEQKGPWHALDEARRLSAISALQNNPRMQAPYGGEPYHGYGEFKHRRVFSAAWELAGKVPVNVEWAAHLCWLYEKLSTEHVSVPHPLQLAARWVPDPADVALVEREREALEGGHLENFARTRRGIARLSVGAAHEDDARRALASHDDPALRAAVYFSASMTVDEMKLADERDPLLSFEQMMWNRWVWRTKEQREQLRVMAWDGKRDPNSYMDPQSLFSARREAYRKEYPDWFKDDEEVEDPHAQPLSSDDFKTAMEGVKNDLIAGNDLARTTYFDVLKVLTRTTWLGWGVAALLAIVLLMRR